MHPLLRSPIRIRQRGQTLVIALIVLGVLLVLGLVFLGLINRNILNAARSQRRSESSDLATGGIQYAHSQLVSSPLGADWRGVPATLRAIAGNANVTGDPDAYYLRPKSGLDLAVGQPDLGGPDGFGPYVRVSFPAGRALVRVRYGAADASPTKLVAGGPLRNLGAARSTLIIEGVGRTGVVNPQDPTTLNAAGGLQFQGFADRNALLAGIASLAQADGQLVTSRRMVAYVPIGIIDAARFETNVFNSSAPIDLGIADGLGATAFDDVKNRANPADALEVPVGADLELTLGSAGDIRGAGRYGGSLIANGDVLLHGRTHAYLNRTLGDTIRVAGRIYGADGAELRLTPYAYQGGAYVAGADISLFDAPAGASYNSQRSNFSTAGGLVYDGSPRTDPAGYASGVGALPPPSTLTVDPETKLNRYVALTRETGTTAVAGDQRNSGQYGHGNGVYVDNGSDRQEATDAEGRKTVGSQQSLFDDYLHPNSGAPNSGWKGPFYVPRGAVVQLLPDGFLIQRDGSAPADERTWKNPDGSNTGRSTLRYRIGSVVANGTRQLYVLDTATATLGGQNIDSAALDFTKGIPFNGVLYFEGNVRVRGTIPTSVQLTLVSGATIYIDGAITKGTTNNDVTGGNRGQTIAALPTATPHAHGEGQRRREHHDVLRSDGDPGAGVGERHDRGGDDQPGAHPCGGRRRVGPARDAVRPRPRPGHDDRLGPLAQRLAAVRADLPRLGHRPGDADAAAPRPHDGRRHGGGELPGDRPELRRRPAAERLPLRGDRPAHHEHRRRLHRGGRGHLPAPLRPRRGAVASATAGSRRAPSRSSPQWARATTSRRAASPRPTRTPMGSSRTGTTSSSAPAPSRAWRRTTRSWAGWR